VIKWQVVHLLNWKVKSVYIIIVWPIKLKIFAVIKIIFKYFYSSTHHVELEKKRNFWSQYLINILFCGTEHFKFQALDRYMYVTEVCSFYNQVFILVDLQCVIEAFAWWTILDIINHRTKWKYTSHTKFHRVECI